MTILRPLAIVGLIVAAAIALLGGWMAVGTFPRRGRGSGWDTLAWIATAVPAAIAGLVVLLGTIALWDPHWASITAAIIGGAILIAPNLVTLVILAREESASIQQGWSSADRAVVLYVIDNAAGWAVGAVLFGIGPAPWWSAPPIFVGAVLLRRHRDRVIPSAFQASVRRDKRARDPYRQSELSAYVAPVGGICLSECGRWLAITDRERGGTLQLWDVDTSRRLWILQGAIADQLITPLAMSPDGRWIAVWGGETTLLIDAQAGAVARTLDHRERRPGHEDKAPAMVFSADSKTLVAADGDLRVFSIDASKPDVSFSLEREASKGGAIALDPGGTLVWVGTTVGPSGRIEAWDLVARARVRELRGDVQPWFRMTRDGARLVTRHPIVNQVAVWNAHDGGLLAQWPISFGSTAPMMLIDGDRKLLMLLGSGGYGVFDLETGKFARPSRSALKYQVVASPADGRFAVLGRCWYIAIGDRTTPTISIETPPWGP